MIHSKPRWQRGNSLYSFLVISLGLGLTPLVRRESDKEKQNLSARLGETVQAFYDMTSHILQLNLSLTNMSFRSHLKS